MGLLTSTSLVHDRHYDLGGTVQEALSQRHQHLDVMLQITGAESDRSSAYAATALSFWYDDYARAGSGSETPVLAIGRFSPQQTHALLDAAAYLQGVHQGVGMVDDSAFRRARHELSPSTLALVGDVLDAYRVVNYRAEHSPS